MRERASKPTTGESVLDTIVDVPEWNAAAATYDSVVLMEGDGLGAPASPAPNAVVFDNVVAVTFPAVRVFPVVASWCFFGAVAFAVVWLARAG